MQMYAKYQEMPILRRELPRQDYQARKHKHQPMQLEQIE